MEQVKLHDFVMEVLVPEGYEMKVVELNRDQLIKLKDIVRDLLTVEVK